VTDLLIERDGHVTVLTVNRPERMNALGAATMADLTTAVSEFEQDPDQYVMVLTATGDKAFCSGADLKEMAERVSSGGRPPVAGSPDMFGLGSCSKPTIAAINGLAVSGGLELAISCDIRIAAQNAWFGTFEVKRGIIAGIAANILPRLMPIGSVMDLMLCGERMDAERAYQLGLVQQVVPHDQLLETAMAKAASIASNSPSAVMGTKQVLRFWRDAMLAEQHRHYQTVMHRVLLSGDFLEGPKAFAEKREPQYSAGWPDPFDR
jgi:enoyl-CoA hydratase/carnithine racemase